MRMLKSFFDLLSWRDRFFSEEEEDRSSKTAPVRKTPNLLGAAVEDDGAILVSPREFAKWAHELYLAGVFSWEEYSFAMPAEMHPDYNATIGALTGEVADPDEPRNVLREWEERLAFLRRHNALNDVHSGYAAHILRMLRRNLGPGGSFV